MIVACCLSLSQSPRKHSGFTLVELMVVMAIIAILATAGLSAYTGYMKKARDAVRIADVAATSNIVLASISSTGMPPKSSEIRALVTAANNGVRLQDPLYPKPVRNAVTENNNCYYAYMLCDGGTGYVIIAFLESPSNVSLVTPGFWSYAYEVGSCKTRCTAATCGATTSDWDLIDY